MMRNRRGDDYKKLFLALCSTVAQEITQQSRDKLNALTSKGYRQVDSNEDGLSDAFESLKVSAKHNADVAEEQYSLLHHSDSDSDLEYKG